LAVAFSGGKDSSSLLSILDKYSKKLKIPFLAAITIDDENPEVKETRNEIFNLSKHQYSDVEFVKRSFSDHYEYSLPDLICQSDKKKLGFTPCTICGVLRRHAIIIESLELEVDYIAMGNTLNDDAATTFLNIIRGQPEKNFRDMISYQAIDEKPLPNRIKPLGTFFEESIIKYCSIEDIQIVKAVCSYANRSLRSDINSFISQLETKDPGILYNIVSSGKKIQNNTKTVKTVQKCRNCNSYSANYECSACVLINRIMS
jgi:uncharacterized protein (TIGR00269 family)